MTRSGGGAASTPFAHASVCVGAWETRYRRVGSGAPAVLLGLSPEDEAAIIGRLSDPDARRRVIVPDATTLAALVPGGRAEESTFARWLEGFLHGLGLESPALVAAPPFAAELERYRTSHADELGPLVILGGDVSADAAVRMLGRGNDPGGSLIHR
jgi:hypothetical protein